MLPYWSDASTSGAATFVVTTNNHTIIQQPAEDSIPNACSIRLIPTRFSDLMPLAHRERPAAKRPREKPPSYELISEETMKLRRRTKRSRNAMTSFRRRAQRTLRSGRRNLRNGAKSVCRNRKSLQLPSTKMRRHYK